MAVLGKTGNCKAIYDRIEHYIKLGNRHKT